MTTHGGRSGVAPPQLETRRGERDVQRVSISEDRYALNGVTEANSVLRDDELVKGLVVLPGRVEPGN